MQVLRSKGKEVVKFTTPEGVTGIVATCIPDEALIKLRKALERKLKRRSRMAADTVKRNRARSAADRYVFYSAATLDRKALSAAKRTVSTFGAKVLRVVAGSMLVEATPRQLADLARALGDWRFSAETKSHRIPERGPLQRARRAAIDEEWASMRAVFGSQRLASITGASPALLEAYASGQRKAAPAVVARLRWLALVVEDLRGAYDDQGIRRWFERPRSRLGRRSARDALGDVWRCDGDAAKTIRELAASVAGPPRGA